MKKKKQEIILKQENNYIFKPKLKNTKLKIKRSVDDLLKWKKDKDLKITELRLKKEKSEILKNKGKKNKGKKVHFEERFYDVNSRPDKSMSPIKPVGERLYDYRIIYEKRRKKKEEEKFSTMFKPNLISNNKEGVLPKTDSHIQGIVKKEEAPLNFINFNKNQIKKKNYLNEKFEKFTDCIEKDFILEKKNDVDLHKIFDRSIKKKKLVFEEQKEVYKPNSFFKEEYSSEKSKQIKKEVNYEIIKRNFEAEIMERNAQIENSIDNITQTLIDEENRLKSSSMQEPDLTITDISNNLLNNRKIINIQKKKK